MSTSKLMHLSYFDPQAEVRLSAYADTLIFDTEAEGKILSAVRFGGYPEMVRAMADAVYAGVTIEVKAGECTQLIRSSPKGYTREISHDGVYAAATLMASDDGRTDEGNAQDHDGQGVMQPRKCYIFCAAGDREKLFEELDRKTAAPLIPDFRDYVLDALIERGDLRKMTVLSIREKMDAWVVKLKPEDSNVVEVLEDGLKAGKIVIPGTRPGKSNGFEKVDTVTDYLNTFGTTVAARIRSQFLPLFDPASEPLSEEVLTINDYIQKKAGYSLYDAQLAVAEAVKRQLARHKVALIRAECGSGKSVKRS